MIKWIGGATLAIIAVIAIAIYAGREPPADFVFDSAPGDSSQLALAQAIPVDEAALNDTSDDAAMAGTAEAIADTDDNPPMQPAVATENDTVQLRQARDERFVIKRILPIEGAIKYGEWHWDEQDVPAGPIVMTVDLEARVISVFRGGYEIGAAAVLLGTQEHPTPLGTFPIRYKMRHNVSEKYGNAPMPYSMFLTSSGIALHGSQVENGYASHGCIGMPNDFAAKVFTAAKKGDKVIITRGETIGMGDTIL